VGDDAMAKWGARAATLLEGLANDQNQSGESRSLRHRPTF